MLPLNRPAQQPDLQALYFAAVQAHNAGDFATAKQQYEQILRQAPNQVDTNYQMGRLLVQTKAAKQGLNYLEKAAQVSPTTFEFWRILVDTMSGIGLRKQAKRTVKRAGTHGFTLAEMTSLRELAERDPSKSVTSLGGASQEEVDRVVFLFQSGDIIAAEIALKDLIEAHPAVAFLHNLHGIMLMQKKNFRQAGEAFLRATDYDPFFPDAFSNLGKAYIELEAFHDALSPLRTALELAPDLLAANINFADACLGVSDLDQAGRHYEMVLKAEPASKEALIGVARVQLERGEHDKALKGFRALLKILQPGQEYENCSLAAANCLGELGRVEEKINLLSGFLKSYPKSIAALTALADEFGHWAQFEEARAKYLQVLELEPNNTAAFLRLGRLQKWKSGDPLIAKAEALFKTPSLSDSDRLNLGFALAKAMEDCEEHSKVFRYLDQANAATRREFTYSTNVVRTEFEAMKTQYTPEFFEQIAENSLADETPIFIVGLPRSGTTLTEQILSNHPEIAGGGEIGSFSNPFMALITKPDGGFVPEADLKIADLRRVAEGCIKTLKSVNPNTRFVTDKMPHTFVVLGFVLALLPNARVVWVSRDPVDNCLSLYKNRFTDKGHRYSNTQKELGDYYVMCRDLMAHWQELFANRFVALDYDKLVADPDTEIRGLISALDLEWNDACLDTQSNARKVKTLSVYQARQPIYKSSAKGWKKYENDLGELLDALREGGVEVG